MAQLRTDYKDEILDASVNTQRKYRMINNADGTVSFLDETVYAEQGDTFGAFDVNETNAKVNEVNASLTDIKNIRTQNPLDENSNPLPPNAFKDSALSIGYAHGSLMGLGFSSYVPILTMRYYETSSNIRTVQMGSDGTTVKVRYSTSETTWSDWEALAKTSDLEYTNVTVTPLSGINMVQSSFLHKRKFDNSIHHYFGITSGASIGANGSLQIASVQMSPPHPIVFPCIIMRSTGGLKGIGVILWYANNLWLLPNVAVESTDTIYSGN